MFFETSFSESMILSFFYWLLSFSIGYLTPCYVMVLQFLRPDWSSFCTAYDDYLLPSRWVSFSVLILVCYIRVQSWHRQTVLFAGSYVLIWAWLWGHILVMICDVCLLAGHPYLECRRAVLWIYRAVPTGSLHCIAHATEPPLSPLPHLGYVAISAKLCLVIIKLQLEFLKIQ